MDNVFNQEIDIKASVEIFIRGYASTIPENEWEEQVWPMAIKYNANLPKSLEPRVLRDVYDFVVERIKEEHGPDIEQAILKKFIEKKVEGTYDLAQYLCERYNIVTIGEKEREMFVYKDGQYIPAENEIIFPEIQRILGKHVTKNAKSETFHKIADATAKPRLIFNSAPVNLIPLKNGVYDLLTKKLIPHSPHYYFTYQFPITYVPNAACPKTDMFLNDVLTETQKTIIEEWIGYYFYRLYLFKKAIIFVGEGNTGKTTLLEVISFLLGVDNIASVSLHKMSKDKFSAAHLYNKHGNLVDELSANDVSDTGAFKIATGGGSITGEYKFGNQFSFLNFAKMTFACNKIPSVTDHDDEAYFSRWIVIKFNKEIEKKIPNFIATLTTEEERSGLFNLAMSGLERLLANNQFTYNLSPIEIKLEMMKSGSSIAQFAAEGIVQNVDAEITKSQMYTAYTIFCSERGIAAETMDMFGKKFLFYVGYATEGLVYDTENATGKRTRGWRGVQLVSTPAETTVDETFENL